MGHEPRKPKIRKRRIIERPRLIRALDRSEARVRMLVAGSGYGKTILAEQWAARGGLKVGWFRARHSAADVAVVARALVAAADAVIPGAGRRLLERLSVTQDPERESTLLAEMLAEDLTDWPDEGWIVIDDYQHLAVSVASETFVKTLVDRSPVQLLISSRVRPGWMESRSILVGEALEIPTTVLSMTLDEVTEVLEGARTDLSSGLVALAHGWPAVVGLAGMSPEFAGPYADVPEALYEFFADHLYEGLDETVRTGLAILATMPLVDRELAEMVLGHEQAERVCDEALRLGIIDERDERLEVHPLVRGFFAARATRDPVPMPPEATLSALSLYRRRREWDSAFELARTHDLEDELVGLVIDILEETARSGAPASLQEIVEYGRSRGLHRHPVFAVAEAELHYRQGQPVTALTLARSAIENSAATGEVAYRLFLSGAQAAHFAFQEQEALDYFRRARNAASSRDQEREARWGELMCTASLELTEAHDLLAELEHSVVASDARDQVRLADRQLTVGFRFGRVTSLAQAKRAAQLLPSVDDPSVRASFMSTYSYALNLAAEYSAALAVATRMVDEATEFRLEFAMPYGLLVQGAALVGLKRFTEGHVALDASLTHALKCSDAFAQQAVYAGRVRAFLHEGRIAEACALEPPDLSDSVPYMRGEVWGSRGLALACIGRVADARQLAIDAACTTGAIEAQVLAKCVCAMADLKTLEANISTSVRELISVAFDAGAVDYVVTSYRGSGDLIAALLRDPETAERAGYIIARADDRHLAASVGVDALDAIDPVSTLSAREREVYDLLCIGLSNTDIAKRLFIEPSTVKAHVHHVFDKVGIRSRTALALNAALRRRQPAAATSADSSTPASDG